MSLLSKKDRQQLSERFAELAKPVKLIVFTQEFECQYCRETRQIAEELASLSDQISIEIYDFLDDQEIAGQYSVDKILATVIVQDGTEAQDFGIRYFGVPAGYEFTSLVEDVMMIGSGESGLNVTTKEWAAALSDPVHLQVFVTPTCPYCPQAVLLAHQLAMESEWVTADMVEATEFPDLSMKYQVMGVPRTVINETVHMEGAAPEPMLLAKLKEAIA